MTNASADGMNTPIQACCAKTETAGNTHPPLFTVLECMVESREAASSIFEDIVLVEGKQRGGRETGVPYHVFSGLPGALVHDPVGFVLVVLLVEIIG